MFFSTSRFIASLGLALWLMPGLALAQPRVVSLTPHATELLFAAGAGAFLVGRVKSSDYPSAALAAPVLGDGLTTSLETVLAARPDWVIGWPSPLLDRLRALGLKTLELDPQRLLGIAQAVEQLGQALGVADSAAESAQALRAKIQALPAVRPGQAARVVILASPGGDFVLGRHGLMNDALAHCGAINVFAGSASVAPAVSRESLLAAQPDLVISGHPVPNWIRERFAVRSIPADWLYRASPRFIRATEAICAATRQGGQSPDRRPGAL